MNTSKNKGEWSELYTFLKLLGDGRLYCGDGRLNRYDDRFYPILEVFRDDAPDRVCYKVQAAKNKILVSGDTMEMEVPQEQFREEASLLLNHIRHLRGSENIDGIVHFMEEIRATQVSAKSTDKADIRIVIHNLHTGSKPELGYSIKSKLGANSTLINSSADATNFIFKVGKVDRKTMDEFNSLKKFKDKFELLKKTGSVVSFVGVARESLHNNLTKLDLGLEKMIAESLVLYYSGKCRTVEEACRFLSQEDVLQVNCPEQPVYEYKMKQFLLAFALGMTAAKPWQGRFNANGGYIVVKEDGDVVCYHFFDRNDLEDYLFLNTGFDTPSTTRHRFGVLYPSNGEVYLKLNLQIRFVN